ncbi:Protoheme IX farnesyltransferase [Buchnera aphidicola (Takecallis arundicolens)]|uniref:heme o synthase n=1 Tax=Buchnera aphidicola TaxID=9 RepID=UPI0034648E2F
MKHFIQLIKPRIIFVNLIAVLGGFFFSLSKTVNFILLFFILFGSATIIASACIFNNIIDIDIDKNMIRTKKRILIISKKFIIPAKITGLFLFFLSVLIFLTKINILSCVLAVIGFFFYVVVYSLYMKRVSIYDVIIGSIAGAMPPLIGYCAVVNTIDLKAILLFLICLIWQIPHSYAILILYHRDYNIVKIPTIVNQKGKLNTLKNIMFYIFIFIILISLLYFFHYLFFIFFILLFFLSVSWFFIAYIYYIFIEDINLSRLLFFWSIIVILFLHLILIINYMFL